MSQIRISSPTAAAAFVLRDRLGERGVTASPLADGTWEVVLNLDGSGTRNPFDRALPQHATGYAPVRSLAPGSASALRRTHSRPRVRQRPPH